MTPSWLALCASQGGAVTSPIAQMPVDIGAAIAVGVDMALVGLHAELLEPDILGVGDDADRDDGVAEALLVDLAVLGLDLRRDALGVGLELLDARRRSGSSCPAWSSALCERRRETSSSSTGTIRSSISTTVTLAPMSL